MESMGLNRAALGLNDDHDSCLFILLPEMFSRSLPIFSQIYFILSLMASIIIKLPLLKGKFQP